MSAELGRLFQSTHSLRSATNRRKTTSYLFSFFPRTPCGVRPAPSVSFCTRTWFQSTHSLRSATHFSFDLRGDGLVSIHALLAECDRLNRLTCKETGKFQSTHSLRSATPKHVTNSGTSPVSIHALLAECDRDGRPAFRKTNSFNPRTPCGVRHAGSRQQPARNRFNPRTPCGVRLFPGCFNDAEEGVSIHALLSECDPGRAFPAAAAPGFNPRTPCGVRPRWTEQLLDETKFQSTHSLRSATQSRLPACPLRCVSIHALLAECDNN